MKILACDAGSHSFKAAAYDIDGAASADAGATKPMQTLWEGEITWRRSSGPAQWRERWSDSPVRESAIVLESSRAAPERLLRAAFSPMRSTEAWQHHIDAVAHRVVHGGAHGSAPALIDDAVREAIAEATPLAPAHNPMALAGIEAVDKVLGPVRQLAVFDGAFHESLSAAASTYAVPVQWRDVWGIRRVGFHGISHKHCAARAAELLDRRLESLRIITCHLGGGCSLAAVQSGRSVDTTMGWTTLDGLVMGERCGTIDPGIILFLLRRNRYGVEELSRILNEQSGLVGLSGISSDMREILEGVESGSRRATLAFDVYVHRLRGQIASMAAALGGLDALAFTGGVGENSPEVRRAACEGLEFLGVGIDRDRNSATTNDADIARAGDRVRVLVVHSRERLDLARECAHFLAPARVEKGV